jgi:hypothetical protein
VRCIIIVMRSILILLCAISVAEIKSAQCRVGCAYEGYETGGYNEKRKACQCVDYIDHDILIVKKISQSFKSSGHSSEDW